MLSPYSVLRIYDPIEDTGASADASSFGLGAVIQQRQTDSKFAFIGYASRLPSETEKHYYVQIEKEALASGWDCGKFNNYLVGKTFKLEMTINYSSPFPCGKVLTT